VRSHPPHVDQEPTMTADPTTNADAPDVLGMEIAHRVMLR
jgi:hypothetical protein